MGSWEGYSRHIRSLSGRLGFGLSLEFLGYSVRLDSGEIHDEICKAIVGRPEILYKLLSHYSKAKPVERTGKLARFADLPGGNAYELAFVRKAILPILHRFGKSAEDLVKSAKILNGDELQMGDVAVEIPALPLVPLMYVVWKGDTELQSSVNLFFDVSASSYLATEDIAVLAELATKRLILVSTSEKPSDS